MCVDEATLTRPFVMASITGTIYCPDNNLLTQRSSCIGRLQVANRVAKSIYSSIIFYIFVVCEVNQ